MSNHLVDYHCHLDLYPDFESLINECEKNCIHTLAVTTTPRAWPKNYELIRNKKYVRPALGLHPQLIADRANEIDLWRDFLPETRYVGEIGLDAGPQYYKSLNLQIEVFQQILKCCAFAGGKILSIHSVRSVPIVLDMFEQFSINSNNKVVLHWFSGNLSNLKRAVDFGCYFSINAEMLKTNKAFDLIKHIPLHRILTETDGPFTQFNQLPARPKNISRTVELLASHLKCTQNDLSDIILSNLDVLES